MDRFNEQLVKAKDLSKYNAAKILTIILLVIGLLFMTVGIPILSLIVFLGGFVIFYCKKYLYAEYEYSITNGEIDIDVIYEAKSRKNILQFNMKEVEILAPKNSSAFGTINSKTNKKISAVPIGTEHNVYCAIVNSKSGRVLVEFVPNKEFIEMCFMYNPKNVKRA